jgi:hypothetical protein
MARKKKENISIRDILKGKFLVDEGASESWIFLLFLVFLGFIMISSAHWVDKKVVYITKLNEEVSELKSMYATAHESLTAKKTERNIKKIVFKQGISIADKRPFKLVDSLK